MDLWRWALNCIVSAVLGAILTVVGLRVAGWGRLPTAGGPCRTATDPAAAPAGAHAAAKGSETETGGTASGNTDLPRRPEPPPPPPASMNVPAPAVSAVTVAAGQAVEKALRETGALFIGAVFRGDRMELDPAIVTVLGLTSNQTARTRELGMAMLARLKKHEKAWAREIAHTESSIAYELPPIDADALRREYLADLEAVAGPEVAGLLSRAVDKWLEQQMVAVKRTLTVTAEEKEGQPYYQVQVKAERPAAGPSVSRVQVVNPAGIAQTAERASAMATSVGARPTVSTVTFAGPLMHSSASSSRVIGERWSHLVTIDE